jgi:steroid 5-alpha reductase family enzyme
MTLTEIAWLLGVNLVLILGVMSLLWLVAVRIRDVSFIDAVWPLAMLFLALVTWPRTEGDALRSALLVGLCGLWAVRLGLHLFLRWRAHGEDRRYADLIGRQTKTGKSWPMVALLFVFLPQGGLAWLTSLPVQLGQVADTPPVGGLGWAGVALFAVGLVFETVGDAQLAAFRRDPSTKGKVLDTGLWRYTRHPNYFGDACVWWGLYLIAAETGPGLASILGPIFLTFTLTKWSGIGITEKSIHSSRPGYADYVRRTSAFIPWPPKRAG